MTPINYNHLYYFFVVAAEGGIGKASDRLHLTPQTISGQITAFEANIGFQLFDRKGRKLQLSDIGHLVYNHAEEIFRMGDELETLIKTQQPRVWQNFAVGVSEVIPKILAHQILNPVFRTNESTRLITSEGDQDTLLASLAVDKLDMVLTDQPLQPGSHIRAFNHPLAQSNLTFFAEKQMAKTIEGDFPGSLSGIPFLMQGKKSAVRQRLVSWFDGRELFLNIVAEFDDSALMKSFGQSGYGVFTGPSIIEKQICEQYDVDIIGRTNEINEYYYAISPERRLKHPAVLELVNAVSELDFED